MAAVDVGAHNNPSALIDDFDDLFDYDVPMDILQDVDADMEVPDRLAKAPLGHAVRTRAEGLGIDEEIQVTKKRAPVAKLDETRLLSEAGIPKLKKTAKEQLKFKGKGHEYSDVARLLNFYQLWLDDLYPRAKFVDCLAIIEKVGHTKRMQAMRKEWIDEGRPKNDYHDWKPTFDVLKRNHPSANPLQSLASDDDLWNHDGLFGRPEAPLKVKEGPLEKVTIHSLFMSDNEGGSDALPEDDLDACLAKDESEAVSKENPFQRQHGGSRKDHDHFEDEMEAMAGLDEMW